MEYDPFFVLLGIGFVPLASLTLLTIDASKPNLLRDYDHCSCKHRSIPIHSSVMPR